MPSDPAPRSNGPSAASYSVPPRPKPGRKPALDKPSEKRKAQNREAQRAFRERKVAHTEELKKDIDELKLVYNDVVAENGSLKRKLREMEETQRQVEEQSQRRNQLISQLQDELRRYKEQEDHWTQVERLHADTQQRLKQHEETLRSLHLRKDPAGRQSSSAFPRLPSEAARANLQQHSPITPPQQSPIQDASCGNCAETGYCKCVEDFTIGLSTVPPLTSAMNVTADAENGYDELEMDFTSRKSTRQKIVHKPGCGFCEDSADCPCNPQSVPAVSTPPDTDRPADPMQISSIVEPGTCLKCQTDPDQRRFCIEVSKSRQLSQDLPESSNKRARLDDGRPRNMTCNELYQASKHVVAESRRNGRSKPTEMESMFNSYTRMKLGSESKTEARPGMR